MRCRATGPNENQVSGCTGSPTSRPPTNCAGCGAIPIKFTDPTNSTAYFVHFTDKPKSTLEGDGQATWRVEINFLEAIGTYT